VKRVLLIRDVPQERRFSMERFADELEAHLPGQGIEVEAMALEESRRLAALRLQRLDSYTLRFVRYPLAARRRDADLYHVVDHGYAHATALLPPERVVITCHDLMLLRAAAGYAGFAPQKLSVLRFKWSTSFLRRAAHVVCDSEATREDVVRLRGVDHERTSVIPLGVAPVFRPVSLEERERIRRDLGVQGRYVIAHVSTGHPYKNAAGTLRVTAAVRDAGLDVVLARIGKPLIGRDRMLAAELRLNGRVLELSAPNDRRLSELYAAADVFVFPSYHEGFGWPPLEAMACGTPTVVSNAAALVAVTGGAALTAPAGDVRGLAAAVRDVLESPSLAAELRERALRHAGGYTWERTAVAYAGVYDRVTAAAARPAALPEVERCAG
jgi:glycosyltransferase involved in cell wall biosynthesis